MNPLKQYKQSIEDTGILFSIKTLLLIMAAMTVSVIAVGYAYMLDYRYIIILCILGLATCPSIYKSKVLYLYEKQRFYDVMVYLRQMGSSFRHCGHIYVALKETSITIEGKIKETVDEALDKIDNEGFSNEEGLKLIEDTYPCLKIAKLHKLFLKVAKKGSNFEKPIEILMMDIKNWGDRVQMFQYKKKAMKVTYIGAVFAALILCLLPTLLYFIGASRDNEMFNEILDLTSLITYQISSCIFIIMLIISVFVIERKYTSNWFEEIKDEELIIKDYNTYVSFDYKKRTKIMLPFSIIIGFLGVYSFYQFSNYKVAIICIVIACFLLTMPYRRFKAAETRTVKELKSEFVDWLIEVELNIQFTTLQDAILETLDDAPVLLKNEIEELLLKLDEDSFSPVPYGQFFEGFKIDDITFAMRDISALRKKKSEDRINNLIDSVFKLQDAEEKEIIEDKIIVIKAMVKIPLAFMTLMLLADVWILTQNFFDTFNDFSSYIQ